MIPGFCGQCQCGAVSYRIKRALPPAYACHCDDCKKQSASAFSMSMACKYSYLEINGKTKYFISNAFSGKVKYNYFCEQCGTRMWHSSTHPPIDISLKVGTLHNSAEIELVAHLWTSKKQSGIFLGEASEQHRTQPNDVARWRNKLRKIDNDKKL